MNCISRYCTLLPAVVLLVACNNGASDIDSIEISSLSPEMQAVRDYVPLYANIAHRGTTYFAPEETEASWRWARDMGTDYLEADIQCSKDGVVLAAHDVTLERVSDAETVFAQIDSIRRCFYRSFRNEDGSQHFSDDDIDGQCTVDSELGFNLNARDYYYAELLMLDGGGWFNEANPGQARASFQGDGSALQNTLRSGNSIVYNNSQYVSALYDMLEYASGRKLRRDAEGRRVLTYGIKPEYRDMTLEQIRLRTSDERGTTLKGVHYEADARYMDFVEYDFAEGFEDDAVDSGNRPGVYIEFKECSVQPVDIVARTYNLLDSRGWNILTCPASDSEFYTNGKVNVGRTSGKVILQTFRIEAVLSVEEIFEGRVPMCYLVDDVAPTDWDPEHYFDDPEGAADVINYMVEHKCHIIGPSVDGEPNNYPNRCQSWQKQMIHKAGMMIHSWSIDQESQMDAEVDAMFTNRSDKTLKWLKDNGLRCCDNIKHPFCEDLLYDNTQAPSVIPDATTVLSTLGY